MEEYPPPQKQNKSRVLPFLEMGLLEVSLVAVGLLLLFGILNYFNILPVSDIFPKQLGFLPRQNRQTAMAPSPANSTPSTFKYDSKKGKELLTQYLKKTVKPEFIPDKIEVKEGTLDFSSQYTVGKVTVSAIFRYTGNTNTPDSYGITIRKTDLNQATPTASLTNSLLTDYFLNPYPATDCQKGKIGSYCENFQVSKDGKQGYGMATDSFSTVLFNCLMTKESAYYQKTSCVPH